SSATCVFLQEGSPRLQKIYEVAGGAEGCLAVRRGSGDQHDVLADRDPSVPMNHGQTEERPACRGFGRDPLDLRLGHPRIVLELECGEPPTLVAANAGESD